MNTNFKLNWNGPAIQQRVIQAAQAAMLETADDLVKDAARTDQEGGTLPYRLGELKDSIDHSDVFVDANGLAIYWGAIDGPFYAPLQELGTRHIPARRFLRNAAERLYPELPARIRDKYRQSG